MGLHVSLSSGSSCFTKELSSVIGSRTVVRIWVAIIRFGRSLLTSVNCLWDHDHPHRHTQNHVSYTESKSYLVDSYYQLYLNLPDTKPEAWEEPCHPYSPSLIRSCQFCFSKIPHICLCLLILVQPLQSLSVPISSQNTTWPGPLSSQPLPKAPWSAARMVRILPALPSLSHLL